MFCRYCGNEINDQAYVCPKCGCLARELPSNVGDTDKKRAGEAVVSGNLSNPSNPSRKFNILAKIFSIVGTALSAVILLSVSLFMMFYFSADLGLELGAVFLAIYAVLGIYIAFIFWPFALATGILALVFGNKSNKEELKPLARTAFTLSIVAAACTITSLFMLG